MGFYRRVVWLHRSFAMTAEVDGDDSVFWCEVLELRVPIASNATEGVNKNQRLCAAVDVIVNV